MTHTQIEEKEIIQNEREKTIGMQVTNLHDEFVQIDTTT